MGPTAVTGATCSPLPPPLWPTFLGGQSTKKLLILLSPISATGTRRRAGVSHLFLPVNRPKRLSPTPKCHQFCL